MITMADTGDMNAFTRARLLEDKATIENLMGAARRFDVPWPPPQAAGHGGPALESFMRRFNEDRLLADVTTKLSALDEHEHVPENGGHYTKYDFGCRTCHVDSHCGAVDGHGWCDTAKLFAVSYNGHPDYKAGWGFM